MREGAVRYPLVFCMTGSVCATLPTVAEHMHFILKK